MKEVCTDCWVGYGLPLIGRNAGGGIMPFVRGWPFSMPLGGAGDPVDAFSAFTPVPKGEPELALLVGRVRSGTKPCVVPFTAGAIRDCCCPLTPACTICRCRARASLSTVIPGTGEPRCCDRLSSTFGFGPASLRRCPGSSIFSLASARRDLKCSWNAC